MSGSRASSVWSPLRLRLALLAVATAVLTSLFMMAVDGPGSIGFGVVGYLVVTAVAIFAPAALTLQVLGGQGLALLLLLGPEGVDPLVLMPAIAGVVVTAELLAAVARLDSPVPRELEGTAREVGLAAGLAAGVFGALALVAFLPGISGLLPVAVASAALFALALRMVRKGS